MIFPICKDVGKVTSLQIGEINFYINFYNRTKL